MTSRRHGTACAGVWPKGIVEVVGQLERAREAHRRQAWAVACDALFAVDRIMPLGVEDLERLAEAADILGRTADAVDVLRRVYQMHADADDPAIDQPEAFLSIPAARLGARVVSIDISPEMIDRLTARAGGDAAGAHADAASGPAPRSCGPSALGWVKLIVPRRSSPTVPKVAR